MRKIIIMLIIFTLIFTLIGCTTPEEDPVEVDVVLNPGNDTVEINGTWTDAGVTLTQGDTTLTFYSNTPVDESTLGSTTVMYSITYEGVEYSVTRYVHVTDQTAPVLVLHAGIDTIIVGETWTNAGCEATDNSEEVLTCETTDTVDTTTAGVYIITYEATDSSGNTGYIERHVHVIE